MWDVAPDTFDGRYFQLDDCICLSKPSRRISLIGAGLSEKGMRAAAQ